MSTRINYFPRVGTQVATSRIVVVVVLAIGLGALPACSNPSVAPTATPLPTYSGPSFLYNTVGSLIEVRGGRPLLVSGFGLIVNLHGTGSSQVPEALNRHLIAEMQKHGVGSAKYREMTGGQGPRQMLASLNTTVVRVRGLIPPGATTGTPFDLLVETIDEVDTQTTSLEAGQLYTTSLGVLGDNVHMYHSQERATGHGPIFIQPNEIDPIASQVYPLRSLVLAGGRVTKSRRIELVLNQPNWLRSRAMATRINEQFGHEKASSVFNTAMAQSDQLIRVNVPNRFAGRVGELLGLINHLYLDRTPSFGPQKARELVQVLIDEPRYAHDVVLAWQVLGRRIIPVLNEYYVHDERRVRWAALEAGVHLGDKRATMKLADIAQSSLAGDRREVARILQFAPDSLKGSATLWRLVNDDDHSVCLAAYRSLADMADPLLKRYVFGDRNQFKFVLDLLPSKKPMVYIEHSPMPRLVLFDDEMAFRHPIFMRFWDDRLILRTNESKPLTDVFYQPYGQIKGQTYEIGQLVANLVFLLAHKPTVEQPTQGLDLPYSAVISAVYQMCKSGHVDAELVVETSPLQQAIARSELRQGETGRPQVSDLRPPLATEVTAAATSTDGYIPLKVRDDNSLGIRPSTALEQDDEILPAP